MDRLTKTLLCTLTALCLLLTLPGNAQAQVKWNTVEQGNKAKIGNRIYLLDFYTDWCGYCKKMDRDTYTDTTVAKLIAKYYYPIKFNAEGRQPVSWFGQTYKPGAGRQRTHDFARGLQGFPTTLLIAADGKPIQAIPGYIAPKEFAVILWYFASGDYTRYPYERYLRIFDKEIRPAMEKAIS